MELHILSHDQCLVHRNRPQHAEQPRRLEALHESVLNSGFSIDRTPAPASDEQLLLAHPQHYLDHLRQSEPGANGFSDLDADTGLCAGSVDAARHATGCALEGLNRLHSGDAKRVFSLTRPPGHHAATDHAAGFCLFNHVAIAALQAQALGFERVAIVDFDVHHGDGTEAIIANRAGLSLHSSFQHPLYPFTGVPASASNIDNSPLEANSGGEVVASLLEHWAAQLAHVRPQLILVSAGFDAHRSDPLAQLNWLDDDYARIAHWLREQAEIHCDDKILAVLEGGYHIDALCSSVLAFLEAWR